MKLRTKKIWTIVLSVFVLIFLLLLTLPFAFRGKIMKIAKQELNKQLTAEVDFKKLSLSFIRNFPNASISLKDIYIAGKDDFAGDTLLISKDVNLVVNLKSIFSDSGYEVKKLQFNDSKVLAHVLKDGRANWHIFASDTTEVDTTESKFHFKLQDFKIENADVVYLSDSGNVATKVKNLNLVLKGDLTSEESLLNTRFTVDTLNFWNGGVRYLNDAFLSFEADIKAKLKEDHYELANNEIKLNAIPFSLEGWVKLLDEGMDMDMKLNTERVDFKSLLSLIPAIYTNSFADVKADGKVIMSGFAKGKMVGDDYPAFELKLDVENGKFQYPSLPKSVDNIQIASYLTNPGGSLDNTVVDVSKFSFNMGGSPFSGKLHVVTPLTDPDFKLTALGKLDLGVVKDVYPLDKGTELNGVLDIDVNAAGKMSWVENNQYENFKFGGKMNVKDMLVKMADLGQDVRVNNANLLFNDRYLDLSDLNLKIGRNDLSANGKAENYLAYLMRDMTLKGDFKVNSNYMNITDFMGSDEENDTSSMTVIKIPKNLDLNLAGNFKELVYNKMNFKNANGQLKVANGEVSIQKMNVNAFGGNMALTGKYSSANPLQPTLDFDMDMQQISFAEIFGQVESLQKFVPIFEKLAGRFNTKLSLNTLLAGDMMPILSSIISNGNFKTEMITLKEDVSAIQELAKSLNMDNKLSNFTLKDIALAFEIKDGKLNTKPFDLKFKDYAMNIGGTTGLDQSIAYLGTVKLPDKLNLGKFQNIGFKIGGTFTKPKVELDLQSTLTSLVEEQKDEALKKVDSAKNVVLDKSRAEREKILQDAQRRSDAILEQAKQQGDRLVHEAQVRSDSLVSKAANPVAKALAKKAADELVKEARKQADNLNSKAKIEADKIIKEAEEKSKF